MSFAELFSIYNNLLSVKAQLKRLHEVEGLKHQSEMAIYWVGKACAKTYDILIDEYPDMKEALKNLRGSEQRAKGETE